MPDSAPTEAPARLHLIYARAANGVIGRDGALPWHLPEDLKYFKTVTTSEAAGVKKPDAGIFDFALKQAGAVVDTCLMIGDDPDVDILGAKEYGMDQVLFDPTSQFAQNGSTFYINDLIELKSFL